MIEIRSNDFDRKTKKNDESSTKSMNSQTESAIMYGTFARKLVLDVVSSFWDPSLTNLLNHSQIEGIIISPSSDARIPTVLKEYRTSPRTVKDVETALSDLELEKYGIQYFFGSKAVIRKYLTFAGAYRLR